MNMKKNMIPQGLALPDQNDIPLDSRSSGMPQVLLSSAIRKNAAKTLNDPHARRRLTLILGIATVLGLGLAAPMITDCLLLVAEILTLASDGGEVLWPVILCVALNAIVAIFFTLPLIAALYRMAALMTQKEAEGHTDLDHPMGLGEILYPFTSAQAYRRTFAVAMRGLGCVLLTFAPPIGLLASATWWIPLACARGPAALHTLLWFAAVAVSLAWIVAFSAILSRGMGLAYMVFVREETSLREIRRAFRGCRRSVGLTSWLLFGSTLRCLLSLAAVLIPFLLHTAPCELMCWAFYGLYISRVAEDGLCVGHDISVKPAASLDPDSTSKASADDHFLS